MRNERRNEEIEAMEDEEMVWNFGQEVCVVERREKMERKKMEMKWKVKECVK